MRAIAVHTCPLWENAVTGQRAPALQPEDVPLLGRLIGWVNVLEVRIGDVTRWLLLGGEAGR